LTLPGGGTTDYAVAIFFDAIKKGSYESFLSANTVLPMMYMPDAVRALIDLSNAKRENLNYTSYNLSALSFSVQDLANEIKKIIPNFEISYKPDYRQAIADSWPQTIDDSAARNDWNWKEEFSTIDMVKDMLNNIK
jgi:nucleoside-diphosphate-sugar epimerase